MKHKVLILAAMLVAATGLFAQSADNEDEVVKIDRMNQNAYREGEILVKFKADGAVQMRAPRKAKFQTSQVNAVDALFEELGVDSVEQLMPMTGHKNVGRRMKAYNGSEVEVKDLSKLYRLTLKAEKAQTLHEAIEKLQAQEEVEYAEPNYLVYTMSLPYDADIPTQDKATYTAEPLYSQQWGIPAINLPALWDKPKKSSKRPVIAILDTGVDIEHPDLAANIWTNTAEANGIVNQDDDANGFKDDIHGWSFIDNHSVTGDFNGHGTHCAGIAAAVGNNGIGITGANPDALIMPVTVMQSNGTGDVATIVKGIDYAAANGADVISMSIGGYGYSITEEQSLEHAYANAILVASAGNDGHDLTGYHCKSDAPTFPAAFQFVLGVEASTDAQGTLASFSNFDYDGPIFTWYGEGKLYNYELRAPGVNILSTFPGGRYKNLNGTSMACPLVAGAISRLIQTKEVYSQELLFGDIIHSRSNLSGNINILSAYNISDVDRQPELELVAYNIVDTVQGDGDGRADAGETIDIYPIIRNSWGLANNIRYWFKTGFYNQSDWVWDDTTLVRHLQDTAYFEKPLSSYAKANAKNPYRIMINPDCADGRKINMTFFAICDNIADTISRQISLEVENGVEIGGMISEDLTLYPNVHYIVTNNLAVPAGVKLTIMPGTILKFKDNTGISITRDVISEYVKINGNNKRINYSNPNVKGGIIAQGKPDSLIVFTAADGETGRYKLNFGMQPPYIEMLYLDGNQWRSGYLDTMPQYDSLLLKYSYPLEYVKISNMHAGQVLEYMYLKNSIISDNDNAGFYPNGQVVLNTCHVINNYSYYNFLNKSGGGIQCSTRTNFAHNKTTYTTDQCLADGNRGLYDNIFVCEGWLIYPQTLLLSNEKVPVVHKVKPNYFGSAKESKLRKYIYDIETGDGFGYFDLSSRLTRPSSEAHGVVWKVLVDGIDAQDEFELLPPIGVGTHKCEVYFNRPMDVSITPNIYYGVRKPYNQHTVDQNGSWSADSTIYTAYFTINGKTMTDGLNKFRVLGAEDNEHFIIPEEEYRFYMEVAATGSLSTGLVAEAGLGKVILNWVTDEEDFADLLGYNIYRWTTDTLKKSYYDNDGKWVTELYFDTICINSSLIDAEETQFIDYDVIPGKDYYYVIRQVTTSLNTYDLSNPVVARPLTAIKGDANGSMTVDVADVITEVNYITRQNPQPFISEAADVNSDDQVNIIDVVATIDLILHPQAQSNAINEDIAYYYIENGILYVESDVVLGGVQCTFEAEKDHSFTALAALNEFEKVGTWQTEYNYLFMAYSMSGKTLGIGKNALLQIGDAELTDIVLSDAQGHNVPVAPRISQALDGTTFVPAASKYIKEGSLYIKHGEHIYNATGIQIK